MEGSPYFAGIISGASKLFKLLRPFAFPRAASAYWLKFVVQSIGGVRGVESHPPTTFKDYTSLKAPINMVYGPQLSRFACVQIVLP